MRHAIQRGMPTAPWWVLILEAAETWGVPPWIVTGNESEKVLWLLRYKLYTSEIADYQKKKEEELNRKRSHGR